MTRAHPETVTRDDGRPREQHPMLVLAVVLTATFVQLVDVSITNVAVPSIRADLNAGFAAVQLVQSGSQLAFACVLVTSARLGDLYGRRRLFLIGMAGFTVASMLCGAAPTAGVLVLARVLQGLMSGLMFPQVLSVIQVVFEPKDRPRAFAVYGAVIGLATILGPLVGGTLIQLDVLGVGWRSIFYVNVPIGIAAFIAAVRYLPESTAPDAKRLDISGAALSALGLFLVVLPLTEGRERGWPAWLVAMLVASVPVLAAFVAVQRRKTREDRSPLIDLRLLDIRSFRYGVPLALLFFAGVPPFFFTFSLYLQVGEGFSALKAGLTTIPFAIASAIASARSARLASRLGRRILLLGCALLVVGMLGVALTVRLTGQDPHPLAFVPALLVCGAGLGCFAAPNTTVILSGVPLRQAGQASGVLSTGQQVGGALGVALIGLVYFGVLGSHAATSAQSPQPALRRDLVAAGLPPQAVEPAVAGFRTCFVDRSAASDPSAQPASCRRRPAVGDVDGAAVSRAYAEAARRALRDDFSTAVRWGLAYEVLVFALAGLLVLRLPESPDRVGAT